MRSERELDAVLSWLVAVGETTHPNQTYEQGVEDALLWVLEVLGDDEFDLAVPKAKPIPSNWGH